MRVDEHGQHAVCPVRLDETNAAHVAGEIEDAVDTFDRDAAVVEVPQVEHPVVRAGMYSLPRMERLDVRGPDRLPGAKQFRDERIADEAARTGNQGRHAGRRNCARSLSACPLASVYRGDGSTDATSSSFRSFTHLIITRRRNST